VRFEYAYTHFLHIAIGHETHKPVSHGIRDTTEKKHMSNTLTVFLRALQ